MKFKLCLLIASSMLIISSAYAQLQLEKGISVNDQNEMNLTSTSLPYAASFCGWNNPCPVNTYSPLAFAQVDSQGNYYALKQDLRLVSLKINTKLFDHGWSLTRRSSEYQEPEFLARTSSFKGNNELGFWSKETLGCMGNHPLRYGDITQDEQSELVLFLTNNFTVFSAQLKKIIFSTDLSVEDWLNEADTLDHYVFGSRPSGKDAQYQSRIAAESAANGSGARAAAYRGYTKLYFGNFDEDNAQDILVWYKFYQSRLREDEIKGFRYIRDTLIHYKLIDGEYKKQLTEQSVIKGWLEAKNLTWQKGYPSKSECPGQEGQLIPEMHDPLLNDPDVLQ